MRAARGKIYRHLLSEWRDEASRKLRQHDELVAPEGRGHRRYRRRHLRPPLRLTLPSDCARLRDVWRDHAEDDPSCPELEPRLVALEPLPTIAELSTASPSADVAVVDRRAAELRVLVHRLRDPQHVRRRAPTPRALHRLPRAGRVVLEDIAR